MTASYFVLVSLATGIRSFSLADTLFARPQVAILPFSSAGPSHEHLLTPASDRTMRERWGVPGRFVAGDENGSMPAVSHGVMDRDFVSARPVVSRLCYSP